MKGVPFVNGKYTKGVPFLPECLKVRISGTQKGPIGHFEVARGLSRSRIALWELLWGRKRFFYWLLGV